MASSGDIRAGRAAVELYVDNTELNKGLKQAETSIKNVDKNVGAMRAGMLANQFAVGLQDFAVVYEQSKDLGRALSAAANNAIQLMTLINPMAGALTAAAIAGYQLYTAFSKAAASAKAMNEAAKAGAQSLVSAVGGSVDNPRTQADVDEAIALEEKKQAAIREVRARNYAKIAQVENQTNVLGFRKTLTDEEQRLVDILKIENEEYNKALAAGTQKINSLQQERQISKEAGGLTTKQIEERQAAAEEDARMEAQASQIWSDVKRQEDQWKIDTEERRQKIAEDQARDAERELEKRRSQAESVTRQFETPSERRARMMAEYKGMLNAGDIGKDTYDRAIASLSQRSESVAGTFSGAALGGLSASSPLVAIQRATERSAKANEETAKNTKKGATYQ